MTMLGAWSEARRALDRLGVIVEIFTDSSSSSGARNAKGCVCTCGSCPMKSAGFEPVLSPKLIGLLFARGSALVALPYPARHPPAANSPRAPALSNRARARLSHKPVAAKPAAPRDTCLIPPAAADRCPPAKRSPETQQPRRLLAARHKSARENLSGHHPVKARSSANAPFADPRASLARPRRAIFPHLHQHREPPAHAAPCPLPSRSPQSAPPRFAPADQRNHIPTPKHPTARFPSRVPSRASDPSPSAPPPETKTPCHWTTAAITRRQPPQSSAK